MCLVPQPASPRDSVSWESPRVGGGHSSLGLLESAG